MKHIGVICLLPLGEELSITHCMHGPRTDFVASTWKGNV